MNLRILKKLSKRAALLLKELGGYDKPYTAEAGDGYTSTCGHDRKHWDRGRDMFPFEPRGREIHIRPRRGAGVVVLSERYVTPWPGTVMFGWKVGYYEPEWEEDDAWSILAAAVREHWMEYCEIPGSEDEDGCPDFEWVVERRLNSPSAILRAAPEVIEARGGRRPR